MAVKKYTLNEDQPLTEKQRRAIQDAENRPSVFDADNPELTDEQLASFRRVHERNKAERRKQNITLRLSPQAIKKAKALGKGYTGILSRIVESALNDPEILRKYL